MAAGGGQRWREEIADGCRWSALEAGDRWRPPNIGGGGRRLLVVAEGRHLRQEIADRRQRSELMAGDH